MKDIDDQNDIDERKKKKPVLNKKKRFYYHVTTKDMSDMVKMKHLDHGTQRDEDEPIIARICVAPDIPHCLSAIPIFPLAHYIYRTEEEVKAWHPCGVADVWVTKEMWLRRPTVFKKIGTIQRNVMVIMSDLTTSESTLHGEPYDNRQRQREVIDLANMMFNENGVLSLPSSR